jgi:hypothetical protein
MPLTNRLPNIVDETRYTMAQLTELRRTMLRFCRSIPPGPERNKHLQIAVSLGRLVKDEAWLEARVSDPVA